MKNTKIQKIVRALIGSTVFSAIAYLAFSRPDWLLELGSFTAIPGYCLILLCFTPLGKLRLGNEADRLPWGRWLGSVAKGHVVLILFTLCMLFAFFGAGPASIEKMNFSESMLKVSEYTRQQWGIFPWGVYGVWALAIAYVAYVKKAPPYLYVLLEPVCRKRREPAAKNLGQSTRFMATTLSLSVVAVSIILLLCYAIESMIGGSHFIFPQITIMFLSVFFFFCSFKWIHRRIRDRRITLTLTHLFLLCILSLMGLLLLAAVANHWLALHYPQLLLYSKCEACSRYFKNLDPGMRFSALYWSWWLVWTPIAGSYLASLSKGRTLREFVLGLYAFPLMLYGVIILLSKLHFMNQLSASFFFVSMFVILPLLAGWMLFKILHHAKNADFMSTGYMPVSKEFKRNRLWLMDASKIVGLSKYAPRMMLSITGTLFLQTTLGWYGLQIQLIAIGAPIILSIYMAFICILIAFFKDKAWVSNK